MDLRYFLSDFDRPYAMDEEGNEFFVTDKGELDPIGKGAIDAYWRSTTKKKL